MKKVITLLFAVLTVVFVPISFAGDCSYVKNTISLGPIAKSCNVLVAKVPQNQRKRLFKTQKSCILATKKHTALIKQTLFVNPGAISYCRKKYPKYSMALGNIVDFGINRKDYVGAPLPF